MTVWVPFLLQFPCCLEIKEYLSVTNYTLSFFTVWIRHRIPYNWMLNNKVTLNVKLGETSQSVCLSDSLSRDLSQSTYSCFSLFWHDVWWLNYQELAEWDFLEKNVFAALGKQPKILPKCFLKWTLVLETE